MRLDFEDFTIAQPTTSPDIVAKATSGKIVALPTGGTGGKDVTLASRCQVDLFTISNPGGASPPTICGNNDGDHSNI